MPLTQVTATAAGQICDDKLTRGVLQLSAPDFLEISGLSGKGMERYPNTKLASQISSYFVKNCVKN